MPCSLFVSTESYYLISNQTTFFTRYQALYWKSRKKNSDSISLSEWSVRCRKLATQTINRIRTRMNTSYLDNCPQSLSKCHRQVQKSNQSFYSQVPIKRVGPNKRVGWIFIKYFCLSLSLFLSSCFFGAK